VLHAINHQMVLPNAAHVRFGPVVWETGLGEYLYPKTTLVRGYCNSNIVADESKWMWEECDVVNFNDLWMAARGGGGGTWGIVTSLIYQLHPRPVGGTRMMKFFPLTNNTGTWNTIFRNTSMVASLDETVEDFKIEFYHQPAALGVLEDDSNACGCDYSTYPHFKLPPWSFIDLKDEAACMGEKAAEAWVGAWRKFIVEGAGKERLLKVGFTVSQLNEIGGWAYGNEWRQRAEGILENKSKQLFGDDEMGFAKSFNITVLEFISMGFVFEDHTEYMLTFQALDGKYPDEPTPFVNSATKDVGLTCLILSLEYVLKYREKMVTFLTAINKAPGAHWYQIGGAISKAHDQMTSIPESRREGAIYMQLPVSIIEDQEFLPLMFEDGDKSVFPGFVGHNHWVRHGPLKADWTKICPLSYSEEEMDELCISEQEAVWGTDLLRKLVQIKEEIDPNTIMTSATGIGFERKGYAQSSSPTSNPVGPPTSNLAGPPTSNPTGQSGCNRLSAAHIAGITFGVIGLLIM